MGMVRPAARLSFLLLFVFAALPALAAPPKLLVTHVVFFTMAPGQKTPFTGYMVIAADGTITAVQAGDPPASLTASLPASQIWDGHGAWVIPGFISAHSHLWQAAYRGLAASSTLPGWIDDLYGKRAIHNSPEDFYWFTLAGALDHLQHGITAAYNFNYGGNAWQKAGDDFDEAQFHAEINSGIRFVHGYQPDSMKPGESIDSARARLKSFLDWTTTQPHSPAFLSVMINGMTAFNNTYQQSVMEAALGNEFHVGNQTHYVEAPEDQGEERSKFRWMMDAGLLNQQMIFGHFIHTDDFILQQTAKAGAAMSWNPLSNGRLASGVADIPKYLKMGIRVGMGVDGEASADLADPFENMRTGLYAIHDKYEDATIMSPYQVLWLHTMGSADVLGVKDKLGSLEPGKYADFVVLDPARLSPVLEDPYANLVLVAAEPDIERVYIGGELMVDHDRLVHQDIDKVRAEVTRRVTPN
ncbi:MAG TPA: amidohydrolase family protein [Acidobacteriaceae bacterium]|jgi:cytosine/adenosine deaminase-related metal-dependent hydrolase|nr:amidohydrolase family protein [Acidobacteriaceae bacterium]